MRVLDLFSGIGGMSLGLERACMRTVAFCEIDPFCRKVLAKHWPDVPIHEDIRELTADAVGPVDIIAGGPPCQPSSRAGQQRGEADDRWLWGEALRLVEALRPRWCLFENPPGIYDVGLDRILATLESLGYANVVQHGAGAPCIFPLEIGACAVDAPHIRQRVWIVAHASSSRPQERAGEPGNDGSEREAAVGGCDVGNGQSDGWREDERPVNGAPGSRSDAGYPSFADEGGLGDANPQRRPQPQGAVGEFGRRAGDASEGCLGDAECAKRREEAERDLIDGHGPRRSQTASQPSQSNGVGHWSDAEWLWCEFDAKHRRVKPGVRLLVNGLPGRVARLKALGNAVVPQVVEQIGRAIMAGHHSPSP